MADFGAALAVLKAGQRITREMWNAPGQFVVLQKGYPDGIAINANTAEATGIPQGTVCRFRPYLMLHTAQGDFVPWAPTVSDVLAEDWTTPGASGGECGATATCPDGTRLACNVPAGHGGLHADGNWDGGQLLYDDNGNFR